MIHKSFYPIITKRRWVLASMRNVCAAGGKPGTISVSVKSFMWIYLVIITGKNNAFVARPEDDGDQGVRHWCNLGRFTRVKLSSDYPSAVLAPVLIKDLFTIQKEFGKVGSTTYRSTLHNAVRVWSKWYCCDCCSRWGVGECLFTGCIHNRFSTTKCNSLLTWDREYKKHYKNPSQHNSVLAQIARLGCFQKEQTS